RTHFLTALGLTVLAAVGLRDTAGLWLWVVFGAGVGPGFLGAGVWLFGGGPGGGGAVFPGPPPPGPAPLVGRVSAVAAGAPGWLLADDLTSAALLGSATTAMLMGHSYLIAPAMSLTPLMRLLGALAASTVLRMALAGAALWSWTGAPASASLETETLLWLP